MQDILKVMKEKNLQPRSLYPSRISFIYEGKIKSFTDKQNLREISTTKLAIQAAAAKSFQSCLTLCDPIDGSPPGRPAHQAVLRSWDSPGKNTGMHYHFLLQCMKVKSESEVTQSCPTLSDTWTAAHQAPLSMGFSRQEY